MQRQRVYVVYEHGSDRRPFGSASIRLLRPLSYPKIKDRFEVSFGSEYYGQPVDVVILDRLWRPDIKLPMVEKLVESVHRAGAKLIYSLDDNFLEMPSNQQNLLTEERSLIVKFLLSQADQVWVTTLPLKERFSTHSSNIIVIPNNLDERLLMPRFQRPGHSIFPKKRFVIGMMGTYTHDDDLLMILPAMKEIHKNNPGRVEFQFIGSILREETREQLSEMTVHFMRPKAEEGDYPYFLLWFTGQVCWDIALSPLQVTPFNQYKSDIKFLDYCAIGSAGIFTRIAAFQDSVQHRTTGLLVDNDPDTWYQAFEELIENELLRRSIAREATNYLYTERILAYHYQYWINALESI